ncbi:MAG: endopeptidase La [Halobacteriovoraceae bacterium]|nr:endopeptidase La [Halobacteriovoraceae bacterium]
MPEEVVVIPILNSPIFPGMIAPIVLSENKFTPELNKSVAEVGYVALNLIKFREGEPDYEEMKDKVSIGEVEDISYEDEGFNPDLDFSENVFDEDDDDDEGQSLQGKDIYRVGVLCKVVKKLKLPDGSVNLLVHGLKRYRVKEFLSESPLIKVKTEIFDDVLNHDDELDAYTRSVINQVKKLSEINPYFNEEMKLAMLNSPSPGALADLVAFALSLDVPEAQDFLETLVVKKRFAKLLVYLKREKEVADIQKKITDEVNDKVNKYQREYFLKEQLKIIRNELGLDEDDRSKEVNKIRQALEEIKMPQEAKATALEELERLQSIPESSPEYTVTRTYLNWIIDLPWDVSEEKEIDIDQAEKILNKDHFGLQKAKQRILEFLAVRKVKSDYDGTILCFAGPPGVGKTSLGHSIAKSLGRKFYRFSLGGMRDEAEIKGHRRTYVGAMPGKLLQALKRVKVNNPVIMLDEIDKLGQSFQGDPASALLEVLDPEQNRTFIDNYLDIPFDLSKVLFIATANYIGEIPEPLLDRMELIELSGYTQEEKISIASRWIIPKQLKKHGLKATDFSLRKTVLKKLITDYAREPGVRTLEQVIAKLCRVAVLEKVKRKRKSTKKFNPAEAEIENYLGPQRFQSDLPDKSFIPGIVTGLAWTAYGGEILQVETIPLNGKGFKLTGQVGDVMNESASLAYSYVKLLLQQEDKNEILTRKKAIKRASTTSKDEDKESDEDFLASHEIHLHLPAGATPKDGPSAGITMALALYSLANKKRVRSTLAMTGELSLTGKVLPVGGIKEKVLAAKRAGIKEIIIPFANQKDLKEVPENHRKGLKFYPVKNFNEVLKVAFTSKSQ